MAADVASVLVLNPVALKEMLEGPQGLVYRDLVKRCVRVTAAAKRGCPHQTGRLRNSIRYAIRPEGRGPVGYVGTDVNYSLAVHEGTKPHDIYPKGKVLVFVSGGTTYYATVVHHPGTKAQPFLRDALPAALI